MTHTRIYIILHLVLFSSCLLSQQLNSNGFFDTYVIWPDGKLNAYAKDRVHGPLLQLKKIDAYQIVQSRKQTHFSTTQKVKTLPEFIDPVKIKSGLNDPGFYAVIAYFDHDPLFPDLLSDYQCGNLTYDSEDGYNHGGTDYFPWPFPWHKMYHNEMEIVAAAKGILVYKQDGNNDQHCEVTGEPWNGLTVLHDDGSASWYIHMKKGSLSEKEIGEEVEAGEYLGVIGSSGNTLAPHLHFEVYNDVNELVDPFAGPCNETSSESWWIEQKPYKESAINKISTNKKLPFFSECPEEEIINESDVFYPGDTIWLMSYIKNIFPDDQVEITIRKPNDSISSNWFWTSPWEFLPLSWLYFYIILEDEEKGTWSYEVKYKGITYYHLFQFLESQYTAETKIQHTIHIRPNPVSDRLKVVFDNKIKGTYKIELWNVNGMLIYAINMDEHVSNELTIDFMDYPSGVYFLRCYQAQEIGNFKIIKK